MNTIPAAAAPQVIQQCAAPQVDVLSIRHEVLWPDGSRIGPHPVRQHGCEHLLLRALHHDGLWLLIDLGTVAPDVAAELPGSNRHTRPGVVVYGLRKQYLNAGLFAKAAREQAVARWVGQARADLPVRAAVGQGAAS